MDARLISAFVVFSALLASPAFAALHPSYAGFAQPAASFFLSERNVSFGNASVSLSVSVSVTDSAVYRYAYASLDGSQWTPVALSGENLGGAWLNGSAAASLSFSSANFSLSGAKVLSRRNFLVVYTCSRNDESWDCHDGWQILQFNATFGEQVAVGGVTITSSLPYDPATRAAWTVDGDASTASRWSANAAESWLRYDLPVPQTLSRIRIAFVSGDTRRTNVTILVSPDGSIWTAAYDGLSSGTTSSFQDFPISRQSVGAIRIIGHGNTQNAWNSIAEVSWDDLGGSVTECTSGETQSQSCSIDNGVGSQSRTCTGGLWSLWGACIAVSCDSGYALSGGACVLPDACETDDNCDDGNASTTDTCSGTPLSCSHSFNPCVGGDGQCPSGCTPGTDSDCIAGCTDFDGVCSTGCSVSSDNDCSNHVQDIPFTLKSASDYSAITYIDPTYAGASGEPDGSMDRPYTGWSGISFQANHAYLQKRGTTATITGGMYINPDNVLIGAYGAGTGRAKLQGNLSMNSYFVRFHGSDITMRDMEVAGVQDWGLSNGSQLVTCGGYHSGSFDTTARNHVVYNCDIHTGQGLGIGGWALGIRILNSQVHDVMTEGIYIQNSDLLEISNTDIYNVNQRWLPPSTPENWASGDGIQLDDVRRWWIHGCVINKSTAGDKFDFITGGYTQVYGTFEHNTLVGPIVTNVGGANIYITDEVSDMVVRYNTIIGGPFIEAPSASNGYMAMVAGNDNLSFYGNIVVNSRNGASSTGSGCRFYNNVFVNSVPGMSSLQGAHFEARNNIFWLSNGAVATGTLTDVARSNNMAYGGTAPSGTIIADPLFVDAAGGDYRLQPGSPGINAGMSVGIAMDRDGTAIPQGSAPDIGAYENE